MACCLSRGLAPFCSVCSKMASAVRNLTRSHRLLLPQSGAPCMQSDVAPALKVSMTNFERRIDGASVPESSTGTTLLPAMLSVIAGSADIIGFLGFNGLFTAHITGNLAILAARVANGG